MGYLSRLNDLNPKTNVGKRKMALFPSNSHVSKMVPKVWYASTKLIITQFILGR